MSSLAYSGLGLNYTYGYDTLGNITSVVKNGSTEATYAYDLQNQLVSETVGGNTYAYNYDTVGNLMSVQKNGSTIKSYTYGDSAWADLLTAFTVNGVTGSITYDNVGNPLTYYNGTSYAMTWTPERRLATLAGGGKSISYAYDMDGIRTSKTVNGTTTSYTTVSGQVVRETTGSSVIDFAYEDTGAPYAMRYNGSIYYYLLNLQGDVVGLVDASGSTVASYSYDAWGNVLSATGSLAAINPLRYRGYYYDSETGLYYVQSRYYDPMVGRWISADGQISGVGGNALGNNMFAYCFNNPVNMSDSTGNWPEWIETAVSWVENKIIKPISVLLNKTKNALKDEEILSKSRDIILQNVEFSAGIGVGIGGEFSVKDMVSIEAVSRMDFVGIQFKEGQFDIGHIGRSSLNVGIGPIVLGPQSDTFEEFNTLKSKEYEITYFDIGPSLGKSAAFFIGYHIDASISILGIFKDFAKCINQY